jgi:deoxyhypusine synthase
MNPVKALKIKKGEKISKLVGDMKEMGFGARKLAEASQIFVDMVDDKDCKVFLGVAGALVPAGMKEVIMDMLDYSDVLVITGANLTHDLIESLGEKHYMGDEKASDEELNKKGIDRIYDVFMENKVYSVLEKFFDKNFDKIKEARNIRELLWKLGELVEGKGILGKCWKNKIPIFCPAISDSGIGLMIWGKLAAGNKIEIDAFDDMKEIIDMAWTSKKSGVVYIGGGVPKNFIQQSMQFSKGASYGIQITTDRPEPGGSSGAPLKEGISWGKLEKKAKYVNVFCDSTIALPIILGYAKDKLKN